MNTSQFNSHRFWKGSMLAIILTVVLISVAVFFSFKRERYNKEHTGTVFVTFVSNLTLQEEEAILKSLNIMFSSKFPHQYEIVVPVGKEEEWATMLRANKQIETAYPKVYLEQSDLK